MLTDFKKKKEKLLEIYNKKEILDLFPVELMGDQKIDIESHREKMRNLQNESFYLTFVGQIKAGKSTLLNALIFGDNVLPVDDTPHTAKITIIKYSDRPYFKAFFYSNSEWEVLKSTKFTDVDGTQKSYFDVFLRNDINISISKGVNEKLVINSPPKEEANLNLLHEYVAKNGKYTPFVKNIELYYPSELIKDIIVVDTPGTNDPNEFRSKMTEEWIHNSDAVVYVSYAGRSIDSVDVDFMDRYLTNVDPDKRIIVINKIDTVSGGTSELISWVNTLKSDPDLNMRIFNDNSVFVYMSSLAALINSLKTSGKKLNEDLKWYEKQLKDYLLDDKNGIVELKKAIEEKIIKNKGNSIIESHKNYILKTLIENKIKYYEIKIKDFNDNIVLLNTDKTKLENEKKKYEELQNTIQLKLQNCRDKFKETTDRVSKDLKFKVENLFLKLRDEIRIDFASITNLNNLKAEATWKLYNNVNRYLLHINKIGDDVNTQIKNLIDDIIDELKNIIKDSKIIKNPFNLIFQQFSFIAFNEISIKIHDNFSKNRIIQIIDENTSFWGRQFRPGASKEKAINAIIYEASEFINKLFQNLVHNVFIEIKSYFDTITKDLEETINKKIDEIKSEIKKILDESTNKNNLISQYTKEIDQYNKKLSDLNNLKNQIIKEV